MSHGSIKEEVLSSIAGRLARLDKKITPEDKAEVQKLAGDKTHKELTTDLVQSVNPDDHIGQAKQDNPGVKEPTANQIKKADEKIRLEPVKPLHNPELRKKLVELHKTTEQTIDTISQDELNEVLAA